jgi:hypothetical protein
MTLTEDKQMSANMGEDLGAEILKVKLDAKLSRDEKKAAELAIWKTAFDRKHRELKQCAGKIKRNAKETEIYKIFSTGYMNGASLTPKQIKVFKFYTASRMLVADWWKSDASHDIAVHLGAKYMGVKPPHPLIGKIYFNLTQKLHPKMDEWMDCGLHVYGKMCHYF